MSTIHPYLDTASDMVTMGNVSAPPDPADPSYLVPWGWVVLYGLLSLAMIIGNGLVIVAVYKFKFLRTMTNAFVVGVSSMDLMFSGTGILRTVSLLWPSALADRGPCLFRLLAGSINGVVTSSMLLCIACERAIGTFLPLHYPRFVTHSRVLGAIIGSIAAPMLTILPAVILDNRWRADLPCVFFAVLKPWVCCLICGWILICIVITVGIYLCILRTAVKLRQQVLPAVGSSGADQQQKKNYKVALNLFIIVVLFMVCLCPFLVASIVICWDRFRFLADEVMMRAYVGMLMMYMLNSLINPVVYAIRFKRFTVAFKLMFGLIKEQNRSVAIESTK